MNKFFKKKSFIIGVLVIGIACLGAGAIGIVKNYYDNKNPSEKNEIVHETARKERDRLKDAGEYDPKKIDKEQIKKKAENVAERFGMSVSEAEEKITTNSIEKKALYMAAEDAGVTVSDDEVTAEINKIKELFVGDPEGKKELDAEIAGMGMTEDEYWEYLRPQYKSNIIVNKYLKMMYEKKCDEEGIAMDSKEFAEKQSEWRKTIAEDAIQKYNVTVD